MRIGLFVNFQKATVGGGATFEQNFIESLKKINTNHEFFFFYFSKKRLFDDCENITFININPIKRFKLKDKLFKFWLYWYDIEMMYYYTPAFYPVDLPYAITVWDLNHNDIPAFPEVSRRGGFDNRQASYMSKLPRATRIIIGNNVGKKDICTYYPIDERKIRTIPMFTPQDIFSLTPDNKILEKYNLEKNKFVYYPAHFWAHKNHIRLIKAIKYLKDRDIRLDCVLSGVGTRLEFIKEKVREYGIEDQVKFVGFITREELCSLYNNALSLVYCSVFGPDNIPPLEALALGCPAIVSDIDGHKEQFGDTVEYFKTYNHVDLANKIETLINNGISSEKIEKGKQLAKDRCSDNYVKEAIKVLEEFEPILECWEYNDVFKPIKKYIKQKGLIGRKGK